MTDLVENLKGITIRANKLDAPIIKAAISRINELEVKLAGYEEDITNWQVAVETQMGRSKDEI